MTRPTSVRALVIDDSASNRTLICELLESSVGMEVVGQAGDGEEGLRLALELQPDVITLDLEMPRMDGFTFLRLLMAKQPTPVVIISSYARKENVFRALELGAMDFVPKPEDFPEGGVDSIKADLVAKLRAVRGLTPVGMLPARAPKPGPPATRRPGAPMRVVAIGASTGGPPALQHIIATLPAQLGAAIVIAQHMPARFTHAFALRIDRASNIHVREAEAGDVLEIGTALLAPGGKRMEVVRSGGRPRVVLMHETDHDAYVPSVDALFSTVARIAGTQAMGVVLTGMGRDGRVGVERISEAGGVVIAESEATAIVYGMPKVAMATGFVQAEVPLYDIARYITQFAEDGTLPGSQGR